MSWPEFVARAAARYPSRWSQGWARGKLSGDPVYRAVLALLEPGGGGLLDVGCGEGYLLALVREALPDLALVGLDHDPGRLALARAALAREPRVTLEVADARRAVGPVDVVTCLDVLHYLPPPDQDALLASLAALLHPGGRLVVRDAEAGAGWRAALTAGSERLLVALGRHKGQGVYLRPREATLAAMTAAGLSVEVVPCQAGTPFSNLLYVGTRAGQRATTARPW